MHSNVCSRHHRLNRLIARCKPNVLRCQALFTQNKTQSQVQEAKFSAKVISSIGQVPAEEWDRLAMSATGSEVNPLISHAFLSALEIDSACREEGWGPSHLLLYMLPDDDIASKNGNQKDQVNHNDSSNGIAPEGGQLVGAVPLYLKSHSYGEYVFDSSWARFAPMVGERYYPKLQGCVPFSPVTGPRMLTSPPKGVSRQDIIKALGTALIKLADAMKVSGVHLTFNTAEEAGVLEELGFATRLGLQFHWDNNNMSLEEHRNQDSQDSSQHRYKSFEDFLTALKQTKRKSVRQERKSVRSQGLRVRRLTGDALRAEGPQLWNTFHEYYEHTVDMKWGTAYLKPSFFHKIGQTMADQVLLVVAEEQVDNKKDSNNNDVSESISHTTCTSSTSDGDVSSTSTDDEEKLKDSESKGGNWRMVAASLNIIGSHTLYGRNWVAAPGKQFKHLHFELCYYQALEEAINRGMPRVEAGAQGEHKLQRGYLPNLTYSSHWIRNPGLKMAVERAVEREKVDIILTVQALTLEASPYKRERTAHALLSKLKSMSSSPVSSLSSVMDSFSMDDSSMDERLH